MNRFLREGSAEKDGPKLLHSHHKDHVFESIMSRTGGQRTMMIKLATLL